MRIATDLPEATSPFKLSQTTYGSTGLVYKERREHLAAFQRMPLNKKIEHSEILINLALQASQKPAVAWSGGKDSTALLFLVLQQKPDIDVVWVNTGVEYPECVRFIYDLADRWHVKLHIARPKATFWQVVDKYGYPFFGKGNSRGYWFNRVELWKRKGRQELARVIEVAKASTECCRILKEKPADEMYRNLGIDLVILGNIVAESHQRLLIWIKKGEYFYSSSEGRWKLWPLSIWTEADIWRLHDKCNIPHAPIYDMGHRRNGCWPCLMDFKYADNHLRTLRQSHPKLWRFLIEKKGIGQVILALKLGLDAKEANERSDELKELVRDLLNERPCFFDTM